MSITGMIKSLITGRSDEERLGQVAEQIAATEAELARLDSERHRYIVPRLEGEPNAAKAIASIDADTAGLRQRLGDLRQAKGEIERRLAVARQAAATAEEQSRRQRIAETRAALFEQVKRVDAAAAMLAAEMKEAMATMAELAQAADSAPLRKWVGSFPTAMRNGITPLFDIDPAAPKRQENNLLGLISSWHGERAHWPVARFAEEMLDIEAPVFKDHGKAEACRERLAKRGMKTFVIPLDGGLFVVVPPNQAFATQVEAEGALRSISTFRAGGYALAPWREGWLILPQNLASALPREAA